MKTVFVSRHPGAAEWARRHGFADVDVVPHFVSGDYPVRVIGTLPANVAAAVCAAGGEYHHLSLDLPADARGRELTADDMEAYGARIDQLVVLSMSEFDRRANAASNYFYAHGYGGRACVHDFLLGDR